MEILRPAFGILRRADRHLRQGGSQGHQFGFGDRHTYDGDTFYYVGYRLIRLARGRDKGHPASFVAVPRVEWSCNGAFVAVLLQGVADGRRVARGAD